MTAIAKVAAKSDTQPLGGSVQFAVDGINAGRPVPLEQRQASFTTSFEDAGAHRITATYSGDANRDESVAEISIHVSE